MTLHYTTGHGIAYLDKDTPLKQLADVTQAVAQSLDDAMSRAGYTPPDATTFTALNTKVNDNTTRLGSLESSRTADEARLAALELLPDVMVYRTAAHGVVTAGARTVLSWDVLDYQSGGVTAMWAAGVPTRLVCRQAGRYEARATITWPAAANRSAGLSVRKTTAAGVAGAYVYGASGDLSTRFYTEQTVIYEFALAVGDYVEFFGELDGGTATNLAPVAETVAGAGSRSMRAQLKWVRP